MPSACAGAVNGVPATGTKLSKGVLAAEIAADESLRMRWRKHTGQGPRHQNKIYTVAHRPNIGEAPSLRVGEKLTECSRLLEPPAPLRR
jgi:hypothetical protein